MYLILEDDDGYLNKADVYDITMKITFNQNIVTSDFQFYVPNASVDVNDDELTFIYTADMLPYTQNQENLMLFTMLKPTLTVVGVNEKSFIVDNNTELSNITIGEIVEERSSYLPNFNCYYGNSELIVYQPITDKPMMFSLVDMHGRPVLSKQLNGQSQETFALDVPTGIYIASWADSHGIQSKKILIP